MAIRGALIAGGLTAILAIVLIVTASPATSDLQTARAMDDPLIVVATTAPPSEVSPRSTTSTRAPLEFATETRSIHDWGGGPSAEELESILATLASSTAAQEASVTESAQPGPPPISIPRPACGNSVGSPVTRTAPFTGLSASMPADLPAVVVKVSNNDSRSRAALIGLDQADIVFEQRIEASATRFFSLFHSSTPTNVGPVRSGRATDIELSQNLNRPVFGYSGSNNGVAALILRAADNGNLVPFINRDSAPFIRDSQFRAPDNLFVDSAALGSCGGGSPAPIFSYTDWLPESAVPATSAAFNARSPFRFDWNGNTWTRSQDGTTHTTRTGATLAPDNVVVLFVNYTSSSIDASSVDARTVGTGAAWLFRDGTATIGNWRRDGGLTPYSLTDSNGVPFGLKPGQTWVVLAPAGSASWQ